MGLAATWTLPGSTARMAPQEQRAAAHDLHDQCGDGVGGRRPSLGPMRPRRRVVQRAAGGDIVGFPFVRRRWASLGRGVRGCDNELQVVVGVGRDAARALGGCRCGRRAQEQGEDSNYDNHQKAANHVSDRRVRMLSGKVLRSWSDSGTLKSGSVKSASAATTDTKFTPADNHLPPERCPARGVVVLWPWRQCRRGPHVVQPAAESR